MEMKRKWEKNAKKNKNLVKKCKNIKVLSDMLMLKNL